MRSWWLSGSTSTPIEEAQPPCSASSFSMDHVSTIGSALLAYMWFFQFRRRSPDSTKLNCGLTVALQHKRNAFKERPWFGQRRHFCVPTIGMESLAQASALLSISHAGQQWNAEVDAQPSCPYAVNQSGFAAVGLPDHHATSRLGDP